MLRFVLAVVTIAVALVSCGESEPSSMVCSASLGTQAARSQSVPLSPKTKAVVAVGPYVGTFVITSAPVHGRGAIRVDWTGPDLAPGTSAQGAYDAKAGSGFSGKMTLPEGSLSYGCGVPGIA